MDYSYIECLSGERVTTLDQFEEVVPAASGGSQTKILTEGGTESVFQSINVSYTQRQLASSEHSVHTRLLETQEQNDHIVNSESDDKEL